MMVTLQIRTFDNIFKIVWHNQVAHFEYCPQLMSGCANVALGNKDWQTL